MKAGQTVQISVDATGKTYHGKVTQIGGATGSVLSLFPPENATGNYVKVVQRVPVRIDFTDLEHEDPEPGTAPRPLRRTQGTRQGLKAPPQLYKLKPPARFPIADRRVGWRLSVFAARFVPCPGHNIAVYNDN